MTVDTTVQPKNITFPTDAKLLHAGINGIVRLAKKHRVQLRQSYLRIAKRAAMMAGRYAHAKQFKRHHRQLRLLRTRLGRIIRDVRRKIAGQAEIEAAFEWPLARANQVCSQQQRQRGWKLYSFHAPEVECIGKGKASAPYELMAWTTPALSGNLEAPEQQEHKPCPIRTLRQSVSILGRTSFMSLVLMLPVQSRYAKNDPEINSNNRWQIYRHA